RFHQQRPVVGAARQQRMQSLLDSRGGVLRERNLPGGATPGTPRGERRREQRRETPPPGRRKGQVDELERHSGIGRVAMPVRRAYEGEGASRQLLGPAVPMVEAATAGDEEQFGKVVRVERRPKSRRQARQRDVMLRSPVGQPGKNQPP